MASFWAKRWEDIRGNLLWAILSWILGGGVVATLISLVQWARGIPFEWWFFGTTFAVSLIGLLIVNIIQHRNQDKRSQPTQQSQAAALPAAPSVDTGAVDQVYRTFDNAMLVETEDQIRTTIAPMNAPDREKYLVRLLATGFMAWTFDTIWYTIFGSQITALQELNRHSMQREDLRHYYNQAATAYPHFFGSYSFDRWVGYLMAQILIREDYNTINITIRGQEFLKWLIQQHRSVADRSG